MNFFQRLINKIIFSVQNRKIRANHNHVWKETARETLGSFIDFGDSPQEMMTIYRIGVYETCLLTGEKRIREIKSFFPRQRNP
jgi:hypothetical protein